MINGINVDFSNISNNTLTMNQPLKLSPKLAKLLKQIGLAVATSRKSPVIKLEINSLSFQLPSDFAKLLIQLGDKADSGSDIQIISSSQTLTTQQAADYLGYSRPTLIKLLDEYRIPISLVGRHRKIEFSHVMHLENLIKAERQKFLEEMAKEDYELGKLEGFDPVKE